MPDKYILNMTDITKRFPGVLALDHVSLRVKEGEVHALLGENGAGKSTLMKILAGAYVKDEGEIEVFSQKVGLGNPKAAENLGISIIYQELNLIPALTVAENIFLGRYIMSGPIQVNWKQVYAVAEEGAGRGCEGNRLYPRPWDSPAADGGGRQSAFHECEDHHHG